MSFIDKTVDWNSLIKFTKDGVTISTFTEVRDAITKQFKTIYGEDIDLSTASADGVYVQTLSLMISNILQSFKQFYNNLDVRTASGSYLDALCALSNITRKGSTHSTCSVVLTLDEDASSNYTTKEIVLADKNGNTWTWSSSTALTFEPGKGQSVIVTCDISGPVKAQAGWIDRLVSNEVVMTVSQTQSAEPGSWSETDTELRARRASSLGASGITTLNGLVGALLAIDGIEDVKVYNNSSESVKTTADDTEMPHHSIYVVLRRAANIEIADSLICKTVYQKLTPGIQTAASSGKYGTAKTAAYTSSFINQTVNWKEATSANADVNISITTLDGFAATDDSTAKLIAQAVIDKLNAKQISSTVYMNELWNSATNADPKMNGASTYRVESISIGGASDKFILPDCYFNYSIDRVSYSTSGTSVNISIKGE